MEIGRTRKENRTEDTRRSNVVRYGCLTRARLESEHRHHTNKPVKLVNHLVIFRPTVIIVSKCYSKVKKILNNMLHCHS